MNMRHEIPAFFTEALEDRRMLAVGVNNGVLNITAGANADTITVSRDQADLVVRVNKSTQRVAVSTVQSISIKSGDGNDKITISGGKNGLKVPITVDGGGGNDVIVGGRDSERLIGNKGNDTITGNAGNDTIRGGDGNDVIIAGAGNDSGQGDKGNDLIYGDAGNDQLFGNDGKDTIGGDDEDTLSTGPQNRDVFGNDVINGGAGDDWLLGGTRNDFNLLDNNGQDTFTGGPGADIIDPRGGDDTVTDKSAGDFVPVQDAPPAREQVGDTHTHQLLKITVNGKPMLIPANAGIFGGSSLRHIHTHYASDDRSVETAKPLNSAIIHFESPSATSYALKEFFAVWGISFSSNHIGRNFNSGKKKVRIKAGPEGNLQNVKNFENFRPGDRVVIEITYG